jgi:hypothetical protein
MTAPSSHKESVVGAVQLEGVQFDSRHYLMIALATCRLFKFKLNTKNLKRKKKKEKRNANLNCPSKPATTRFLMFTVSDVPPVPS